MSTNPVIEALENIGKYKGEGALNAPWREIVAALGKAAREAVPLARAQQEFIEAYDAWCVLDDNEAGYEFIDMVEARQELQQLMQEKPG